MQRKALVPAAGSPWRAVFTVVMGVAPIGWWPPPGGIEITERIAETSPRLKARVAGVFYLLTFLTGGFALAFSGKFVVPGDAAATAANILAHQSSVWVDFAANMLVNAVWLLVKGVNAERWQEQASAGGAA